jgi:hypothetical protein
LRIDATVQLNKNPRLNQKIENKKILGYLDFIKFIVDFVVEEKQIENV